MNAGTLELKEEAARLLSGGGRISTAARNLGLVEQVEISRLKAELSPVRMERYILKNHRGPQFRLWAEKRLALSWMVEGSGRLLFGGV